MMKSLSLEKKGFLLVAFPLICQIIFVIALIFPLHDLQKIISEESQSAEILAEVISLVNYSMNVVNFAVMETPIRSPSETISSKTGVMLFRKQLAKLQLAIGNDEIRKSNIERLAKSGNETLNLLQAMMSDVRYPGWTQNRFKTAIEYTANDVLNAADSTLEHEVSKKAELRANSESNWKILNTTVTVMLVLSVALAVLLAGLYVRDILIPLRHLGANCIKISKQEELLPTLKNNDEFSKIDEQLHQIISATRLQQAKEKSMVENTNDFICSVDKTGIVLRANGMSEILLQVAPLEIVGKNILDFVYLEDRTLAEKYLAQTAESDEGKTFEFRIARGDQAVDTRWSCLYNRQAEELFAVVHDIEEEKKIERLKQDFVDMVSHDLRSPLTSMLFSLDMIAEQSFSGLSEDGLNELNNAQRNLTKLLGFVNDLLDFQKLQHGKMQLNCELMDVNAWVNETVEMLKPMLDAKNLSVKVSGIDTNFSADPQKLGQVLMNLLSNAIRHTPNGGQIAIGWDCSGEILTLYVTDQGPGVPLEFQEKIFEAFEQTPESTKKAEGTGLGLAICKLICQAHGGSIWVESFNGKGSKFSIKIPSQPV
jgi:PAS domain S-box-containing protein